MAIDFRDIRWAIIASQHRSLRQAAESLNIRQSTLSRRLRDLEYRLGVVLFERTNGGTRPTTIGQEFLTGARRIAEETEALSMRIRTQSRGESGRLIVGVHTSLSAGNLRAALIDYRQRFPDVELRLVDGSSDHLMSDLNSFAIDIAFVIDSGRGWDDRSLPVWSERLVVAFPEDDPLSIRDAVHWADLKQKPMLLPLRGPGPEFLALLARRLEGPDPARIVPHDASLDRLLTLVSTGWGVLLALEGATGASQSGIIFREVHDANGPARLNFRAYWRQANSNPSLPPFLDMLRGRYPDLSAEPPPA